MHCSVVLSSIYHLFARRPAEPSLEVPDPWDLPSDSGSEYRFRAMSGVIQKGSSCFRCPGARNRHRPTLALQSRRWTRTRIVFSSTQLQFPHGPRWCLAAPEEPRWNIRIQSITWFGKPHAWFSARFPSSAMPELCNADHPKIGVGLLFVSKDRLEEPNSHRYRLASVCCTITPEIS